MIKNFYMSPFYWFGWHEMAQDMEAQNFFLADPSKDDVKNTIKVYPALDAKSDLPRKFRDAQPSEMGINVMKTGFLSSVQFWGAQYFRLWEVVYEGDKVSLFGVLTYDTQTKQASFDEVVAVMATQTKDAILQMFNREYWSDVFQSCKTGLYLCGTVFGLVCVGLFIRNRLRDLRLKNDQQELAELDQEQQI